MDEPIQYLQFLICLFLFHRNSFVSGSSSDLDDFNDKAEFKIEGKVYFSSKDKEWTMNTRVLVDGGNYLGFVKTDGSFVVHGIPSGSFLVEIANPNALFETVRVEITSKGKIRARRVNLLQPNLVKTVVYPLEFRERGKINYFHKREQWRLTDFLFNPMVLTMIVPLLLIMVLPKLMNAADVDTQKVVHKGTPCGKEVNFCVTCKSAPSDCRERHDSELLSQKPHWTSQSCAISCDQINSGKDKMYFNLKHPNLAQEGSQDHRRNGCGSTTAGKQRAVRSSQKFTSVLDYGWRKLEKNVTTNEDSSLEKFFVKKEYKSTSTICSAAKSAETHLDVDVDRTTRATSPSKLRNLHNYQDWEPAVSSCKTRLDLSLELDCIKNEVFSFESGVEKETGHCDNLNNMNDDNQNLVDSKQECTKTNTKSITTVLKRSPQTSTSGQPDSGSSMLERSSPQTSTSGQPDSGSSMLERSSPRTSTSGQPDSGSSMLERSSPQTSTSGQPDSGSSMLERSSPQTSTSGQPDSGASMLERSSPQTSTSGQPDSGSSMLERSSPQTSTSGQPDSGSSMLERSSPLLSVSNSDCTRTGKSITLTDQKLINFSRSNENLLAFKEPRFSSAKSPTLEGFNVPSRGISSLQAHERKSDVNSSSETGTSTPLSSSAGCEDYRPASINITDFPARALEN